MPGARASDLDLASLHLGAGEGRRLALEVDIEPLVLGSQAYAAAPRRVPVRLDVSRMLGGGYALRLRFAAALAGACMRCLKDAAPLLGIDSREVDRPGQGGELESPYVHEERLRPAAGGGGALAPGAPREGVLRGGCAGLGPVGGGGLNHGGR